MEIKKITEQKRRPLGCKIGIKTKISKVVKVNNESRKSISELARIILSEDK